MGYGQLESTVISLGFEHLKKDDGSEDHSEEGSVLFFNGQKKRILNLDKTDGSLDNTKGKCGGRPPLVVLWCGHDQWFDCSKQVGL